MKRHLSDSETEMCDDYEECSSPDTVQISRKKRRGIIEKRRRDRINNCLVELRRLVPAAFEKQGSAKLEKAEILQMTVDHLRHLQSRDPRGFSDPYSPYGNTRAFLDYGIMGFRECTAEISRYLTNMEGVDSQDPMRTRILSHLENLLSQKELAINAAVAANSQITIPKVGGAPIQTPVSIMSMPTLSYAPLTPPRASPDNLSPPATFQAGMHDSLPRFSVAFPIPAIPLTAVGATSKGSTIAAPSIFHPNPSAGFKPVISVAQKHTAPIAIAKPAPVLNGLPRPTTRPLTVITTAPTSTVTNMTLSPISPPMDQNITLRFEATTSTLPRSPTKMPSYLTKAPFRPWADSMTVSTQN